jgi:ABC-type transporter Mla subunit MlaD
MNDEQLMEAVFGNLQLALDRLNGDADLQELNQAVTSARSCVTGTRQDLQRAVIGVAKMVIELRSRGPDTLKSLPVPSYDLVLPFKGQGCH